MASRSCQSFLRLWPGMAWDYSATFYWLKQVLGLAQIKEEGTIQSHDYHELC